MLVQWYQKEKRKEYLEILCAKDNFVPFVLTSRCFMQL